MSTGQSYLGKGDSTNQTQQNGSSIEQTANSGQQAAATASAQPSPVTAGDLRKRLLAAGITEAELTAMGLLPALAIEEYPLWTPATPAATSAPLSAPVQSYFRLEVSTLSVNDEGPSEFDVLTEVFMNSRNQAVDELDQLLSSLAQDADSGANQMPTGPVCTDAATLLRKIRHINNFTDILNAEASAILYQYEKEVRRA